jgi:hypothetical protein
MEPVDAQTDGVPQGLVVAKQLALRNEANSP